MAADPTKEPMNYCIHGEATDCKRCACDGVKKHRGIASPGSRSCTDNDCPCHGVYYSDPPKTFPTSKPKIYATGVIGENFMLVASTQVDEAERRGMELWVSYADVKHLLKQQPDETGGDHA